MGVILVPLKVFFVRWITCRPHFMRGSVSLSASLSVISVFSYCYGVSYVCKCVGVVFLAFRVNGLSCCVDCS
jgi:hypothetical protein